MKILFTGGGTGGHIYPAIALAEVLKEKISCDILFTGSLWGLENKIIPQSGYNFKGIWAMGFSRKIIKNILSAIIILIGCLQALKILIKYNPNLIIGTGGYVSVPIILMGVILKKKSIILEQNIIPGKATKFLSRFVDLILTSFSDSNKYLPDFKTLFIGNPIRGKIIKVSKEEGYRTLDLNKENPIILISGASQGSKSINQAVLKALPFWREQNWQIIHLTGEKHFNEVKENSKNLLNGSKLKYFCFPYLEDIQFAYVVCSLIISRGGATTLAEITALGIPAVLIPYPYSLDFHQYYNIDFLVRNKAAIMLKEEELNKLPELILELFSNPLRLEALSVNSRFLGKPRAALEISEIILNFLSKKGELNEEI